MKKTYDEFDSEVLVPYLKDRKVEVGSVVKHDIRIDITSLGGSGRFRDQSIQLDKLRDESFITAEYLIREIDKENLRHKYNEGLGAKQVTISEDSFMAQEEISIALQSVTIDELLYDAIDSLSGDSIVLSALFDGMISNTNDFSWYNLWIPNRENEHPKTSTDFGKYFDLTGPINGLKVYTLQEPRRSDPANSFRYNFDLVDIRHWAIDNNIDSNNYELICGTDDEINTMIEDGNKQNHDIQLEAYKPLTTTPSIYKSDSYSFNKLQNDLCVEVAFINKFTVKAEANPYGEVLTEDAMYYEIKEFQINKEFQIY